MDKKIVRMTFVLLALVIWINSVSALACINISSGGAEQANLAEGQENYVSVRLYNISAEGKVCEEAYYKLEAELVEPEGVELQDVFDYKFSENNFLLRNTENKRSLLTLIPKVSSGTYKIKVTGIRMPNDGGGMMSYVFTASAMIEATVGEGGDMTEVPFWTVRRDCPDGTVVEKGELCPYEIEEQNAQLFQTGAIILLSLAGVGFAYFGFIRKPRKPEPPQSTPYHPKYPDVQNHDDKQSIF